MQVKQVRLQELRPYEANAKKHDDRQIKNVAESIRQYGFVQPLVVDRNGVIVIGHLKKHRRSLSKQTDSLLHGV